MALIIGGFFQGCIEPFDATFVDFESALVIDASITNETKQQQIILTRTFEFEADGPIPESNADVRIIDSAGNIYTFEEENNGIYRSTEVFAAQPGVDYELSITTSNGRNYGSDTARLTTATTIDGLSAERVITDIGNDGMAILVDSFDPSGTSKNYRYEYEETYRVIAPTWTPISLVGNPEGGCDVIKVPNSTDEEICYPTVGSTDIILTSTEDLEEDRVSKFRVHFISRDNFIISHRYSILVRQFVLSNEAFTFFETLRELSSSESLFSQIQPGLLQGNVFSRENRDENVLGYFDVSSVTEERLFFNYDDFYPGEDLPPYVEPCNGSTPVIENEGGCVLRPILESGAGIYAADNALASVNEGPYLIVPRICGDCSVLGTSEIPEFWIE
ncbi:DUF4249 domain-containing protein [Flagellimonas meishanensis]|uniref:DUF4249 domain-containing protein n=1 Tax=Flagellimonas meishanensis TaxID=2873264 RepID=UPI001CA6F14A|nr:DUF4249 domain-containing protein [[Muricauda] meishanensis]